MSARAAHENAPKRDYPSVRTKGYLPHFYDRLRGHIGLKQSKRQGIKLILVDDRQAAHSAINVVVNAGYFSEEKESLPNGTAELLVELLKNSVNRRIGAHFQTLGRVRGELSRLDLQTTHTGLLNGFAAVWGAFKSLPAKSEVRRAVNRLVIKYHELLDDEAFLRESLVRRLSTKPRHPLLKYAGEKDFTKMKDDFIYADLVRFYKGFYCTEDIVVVVAGNMGKLHKSQEALEKAIHELLDDGVNQFACKNSLENAYDYSKPFANLPSIVFLPAGSTESLILKLQVDTTQEKEFVHKSLMFVQMVVERALRNRLLRMNSVRNLDIRINIYRHFAIFECQFVLTKFGMRRIQTISSAFFTVLSQLRTANVLSLYVNLKNELRRRWELQAGLSPGGYSEVIGEEFLRVGLEESLSHLSNLGHPSEILIASTLEQLANAENLLVVVTGEFEVEHSIVGQDAQGGPRYDLIALMDNNKVLARDQLRQAKARVALSLADEQLHIPYFAQAVNPAELLWLTRQHDNFDLSPANPFAISEAFIEQHLVSDQAAPSRAAFNKEEMLIHPTTNIYFRPNFLFKIPTVFFSFYIELAIQQAKPALTDLRFHKAYLYYIAEVWRFRLRRLSYLLHEFHGKLSISVVADMLEVVLYAQSENYQAIFEELMKNIHPKNNPPPLYSEDYEGRQALESLFLHFQQDEQGTQNFDDQIASFLLEKGLDREEMYSFLASNIHLFKQVPETLMEVNFGLIEGAISKDMALHFLQDLHSNFKM